MQHTEGCTCHLLDGFPHIADEASEARPGTFDELVDFFVRRQYFFLLFEVVFKYRPKTELRTIFKNNPL
ncbi:MAG: hypothetical protein ABH846_02265 [Patescibacteria group bacterium]